jgi:periplasmic divalent cation tolerance protein
MTASSYVEVRFTIDDPDLGESIADVLLNGRLVACCQKLGPIESRYWWEGSVQTSTEWLYLCKTVAPVVPAVIEMVRSRHPYSVPEIVVTEIVGGLEEYLSWVGSITEC